MGFQNVVTIDMLREAYPLLDVVDHNRRPKDVVRDDMFNSSIVFTWLIWMETKLAFGFKKKNACFIFKELQHILHTHIKWLLYLPFPIFDAIWETFEKPFREMSWVNLKRKTLKHAFPCSAVWNMFSCFISHTFLFQIRPSKDLQPIEGTCYYSGFILHLTSVYCLHFEFHVRVRFIFIFSCHSLWWADQVGD